MSERMHTGNAGISRTIGTFVNHDSVFVRFISLWLIVAVVFSVSWIVSYYYLPQGMLRGGNPAAAPDYSGSFFLEFLTLFGWNIGVAVIAVAANTFRSVNTPLGYVLQIIQAPRYGAIWGTGSLTIGSGARIEPSLAVIIERSGPLELTAFIAIVVATRGVMVWHQSSGPRWKEPFDRVQSPRDWSLERREWAVLGTGILLLAIANLREALAIAQVAG